MYIWLVSYSVYIFPENYNYVESWRSIEKFSHPYQETTKCMFYQETTKYGVINIYTY